MATKEWKFPDGKITKKILVVGDWGRKPSEQCECEIKISNSPEFEKFNNSTVVIGDLDGRLGRNLNICLMSMNAKEVATFTFSPDVSVTLNLLSFVSHGYIYQWSAGKKLEIALNHKEKGVTLFKQNLIEDAGHRFIKALKIISSIPLDSAVPPVEVDGVKVEELNKFKATLFGNLASCYLKIQAWSLVVDACKKVFVYDKNNVKAYYKLGTAQLRERSFEEAEKSFRAVLKFEPNNKAAVESLKIATEEIRKVSKDFNVMVKKMFK